LSILYRLSVLVLVLNFHELHWLQKDQINVLYITNQLRFLSIAKSPDGLKLCLKYGLYIFCIY